MDPQKFSQNWFIIILEKILVMDLWLLLNAKRVLNKITPLIKVLLVIVCCIGFFIIFDFARQNRLDFTYFECKYLYTPLAKSNQDKFLQLSHDSTQNSNELQEELTRLKLETKFLNASIRRMRTIMANAHERHKNSGMDFPDFASEAVGGLVISTPDTIAFIKPKASQLSILGIPIWRPDYYTPRKIIQPWTQPGECWAFSGSQGKIEIELAYTVLIDRVTLEHIPKSASLTGDIDSAPKDFNVLGKIENTYILLDTFRYRKEGPPSQTFKITRNAMKGKLFKRVLLEILSNYGNTDYTCIYRFKVHGKMGNVQEQFNIKVQ